MDARNKWRRLIGYFRPDREDATKLRMAIDVELFNKAIQWENMDGRMFVILHVDKDKVAGILQGEREVTSVFQEGDL